MRSFIQLPAALLFLLFSGIVFGQTPLNSSLDCTVPSSPPTTGTISAKLAWEFTFDNIYLYSTPVVANLNPQTDDMPEIICESSSNSTLLNINRLYFFNGDGSNQNSPRKLDIPESLGSGQAISIGDLDSDGIPELVAVCEDGLVRVYKNYDPSALNAMSLWLTSDWGIGFTGASPSLADFDADGVPEIYAGNAVFKLDLFGGQLKRVLKPLTGPAGNSIVPSFAVNSTAADLLSSADCGGDPDCDGLELAAGYEIYSIDIDPNDGDGYQIKTARSLQTLAPTFAWKDGMTAVADMDLDGTPDVVVTGGRDSIKHGVYIWNKNGLLQFIVLPPTVGAYPNQSGGLPCIANVFDDRTMGAAKDFPEIITTYSTRLLALNLNAATISPTNPLWWAIVTSDNSGFTSATTFDLNGDGIREIVYRDETQLRILYGGNAPFPAGVDAERNWFTAPAYSWTAFEYPVVADVDNDGSAEIVVTGSNLPENVFGKVKVFEHLGSPWVPCRNLWNQYNYHVTNVNDDLRIPPVMQKHWLELPGPGSGIWPLNNYLAQKSKVNPPPPPGIFVPDASLAVDSVRCRADSFEVYLTVCNVGSADLPAQTPIAFYDGNPTTSAAPLLFPPFLIGAKIDKGLCVKVKIVVPAVFNQPVFLVVNDNGTTPRPYLLTLTSLSTAQQECHFENNIGSFSFPYATTALDLGPDLQFCQTNTVELVAQSGFARYRWQDGSVNSTLTASLPGKYWVDVWDVCGLKQTDTLQIDLSQQLAFELGADKIICPGDSLQLFVSTSPATVSWTANLTTAICTNCPSIWVKPIQSTLYQATASSGNCTFSDSIRIEIAPEIDFAVTSTAPKCFGESSGEISLNVSGGATPFEYTWSLSGASNIPLLQNLAAGNYAVTVSDGNGCSKIETFALQDPPELAVATSEIAPKCFGESSGEISLNVSGGAIPFDYAWSLSGASNIPLLQNLAAGNYAVTVSDGNGCSKIETFALQDPPELAVATSEIAPKCFGESSGEISLNVSGGITPINYTWSLPGAGNVPLLQNLPAGNYDVTVSDGNGCSKIETFALQDPPELAVATSEIAPKCFGESSGEISLNVSGGAIPFDYNWSLPGAGNVPILQNLPAGNYVVTVSDGNGCSKTENIALSDPPELAVTAYELAPKCFGEQSGEISLNVTGGTTPINYNWSLPGAGNVPVLQNLSAGNYDVTVSDGNGCSKTENIVLPDPPELAVTASELAPKCFGELSGEISLNVSGGITPINYAWSLPGAGNVPILQNLSAGNYDVTVSDGNGCSKTENIVLSDPPELAVATSEISPKCFGEQSGEISLSVTGGITPINYIWSLPGAGNVPILQNLSAGNYDVTVSDGNGCSKTETFALQDPPELALTTSEIAPKCFGESSGEISLNVSGGITPINYAWSQPGAGNVSILQNLPAGNYDVTVSDGNGCSKTENIVLPDPPELAVATSELAPKCFGEPSGEISLNVSGGITPINYTWSLPGAGNVPVLQNLAAGNYSVTVSDGNGCSKMENIVLPDPPELAVTASELAPKCFGELSGEISLNVSGGITPINYAWSLPGAGNVPVLQNLSAGNYSVTVLDGNGCSKMETFALQDPPELALTTSEIAPKCFGEPSGEISLNVSGGITPINYAWSTPGAGNVSVLQNLSAGNYVVTVSDGNGCSKMETFALQDPPELALTTSELTPKCFGESSGEISLNVSGGITPINYAWSLPGAGNVPILQNLPAGNYVVTVSDGNGCSKTENIVLPGPPELAVHLTVSDSLIAPGELVVLTANPMPNASFLTVLEWQPASFFNGNHGFTAQVFPEEDTDFFVKIADQNGCTASDMRRVEVEKTGVFIPNIFAPGSSQNNRFTVFSGSQVRQVRRLQVYDRWGELVFMNENFPPNDLSEGWDGTFRNKATQPGVYLYRVLVEFENGATKEIRGDLTVVW